MDRLWKNLIKCIYIFLRMIGFQSFNVIVYSIQFLSFICNIIEKLAKDIVNTLNNTLQQLAHFVYLNYSKNAF